MFSRKKLDYHIFQIGFNRCGTSSIAHFFEKNGYKTAHWEKGKLAVGIELARKQNQKLLTHLPAFDVYTDMEKVNMWRLPLPKFKWRYPVFRKYIKCSDKPMEEHKPISAFKYFDELEQQYPNSRFILNTRNVNDWIESRLGLNTDNNRIAYRSCRCGDRVHSSEKELAKCWEQDWHEHHERVQTYFKSRNNKLLTFHIEKDEPEKLTSFFNDIPLDLDYWGKRNRGK